MKDCLNTKIEEALNNRDIINIMNKASKRFTNQLDSESIYTCHLNALWKAFVHFDPSKNVKFTTYLYNGVFIECLKEVKFINKGKFNKKLHDNIPDKKDPYFLIDILDEVSEDDKEFILDKLSNMTIEEMAKKRHKNRETVRKGLKNVLSKLRKKIS